MMSPALDRRVIPATAWIVAWILGGGLFCVAAIFFIRENAAPPPIGVLFPVCIGGFTFGYVLLVGYIYGDARRRGMRYVMWMWLAILVPNAMGVVLYFILRDTMPVHCTRCGASTQPGFAYCPRCGNGMAPACGQCQRVAQPGWSHCAYCGNRL